MIKKFFLYFIIFIFSSPLFAIYTENKIPKPKIRKFDILKISDLTGRIQINTSIGGEIWIWNNLNNSEFSFNIDKISIGVDKYFLFYNGLTGLFEYNAENFLTTMSFGYKLRLYEILYTKLQVTTALYPYFDFGISISLGLEFSAFNLLRFYTYNNFTTFLINGKNMTSLYFNYYIGIGMYF